MSILNNSAFYIILDFRGSVMQNLRMKDIILTKNNNPPYRLLYDAECPYCVKFSSLLRQFDTAMQIETVSLQNHFRGDDSISLEALREELHMLGPASEIFRGTDAVQKIISLVPQTIFFKWMIDRFWGRKGSEMLYAAMKKFRKCADCGGE